MRCPKKFSGFPSIFSTAAPPACSLIPPPAARGFKSLCYNKNTAVHTDDGIVAEKEGFEPSRRYSRPTPLAGAPLRPLEYFSKPYTKVKYSLGGERGIRTPGAFRHHWFSRPAPSTTRPSLLEPALFIIHRFLPFVNPCFEFFEENRKTPVGFRRPWIPTSASVPPPSFS